MYGPSVTEVARHTAPTGVSASPMSMISLSNLVRQALNSAIISCISLGDGARGGASVDERKRNRYLVVVTMVAPWIAVPMRSALDYDGRLCRDWTGRRVFFVLGTHGGSVPKRSRASSTKARTRGE